MVDEKRILYELIHKSYGIDKIIEIYTPYLSKVIYNIAGNNLSKEDVEEILEDTFVSIWKNSKKVDLKKGTLSGYLAIITRNNVYKKLSKKQDYVDLSNIEIENLSDEFNKTENSVLWESVKELGEPDSEIFIRFYKNSEKIKTISKEMGINESTIKTKLKRGKEKLKNIIISGDFYEKQ